MAKLYVVTGPSGTGLSDILAELFRLRPDLSAVLPVTSRVMKEGETDGVGPSLRARLSPRPRAS